MSEVTPSLELDPSRTNRKKRILGRGALVFASGWISNATWGAAMAFNRIAEHNDVSTMLPAVGFAIGTTVAEYGMTYLATSDDIEMTWEPKRRVTSFIKDISQKLPLVTSAWRGAATGVYLDAINGRNVTNSRRLLHASIYGGLVGAWASEPGDKAFSAIGDGVDYITSNPIVLAGVAATALAGGVYGYRKTDPIAAEIIPEIIETVEQE